jgi:SCY1-like protein 2
LTCICRTIVYLDNFVEKDPLNKAQFLKGLYQILPQFSAKIQVNRILPKLASEMKSLNLLTSLIPNILLIGDKMDKTEFSLKISLLIVPLLPTLKDQIPSLLMILENMETIMSKSSSEFNNTRNVLFFRRFTFF